MPRGVQQPSQRRKKKTRLEKGGDRVLLLQKGRTAAAAAAKEPDDSIENVAAMAVPFRGLSAPFRIPRGAPCRVSVKGVVGGAPKGQAARRRQGRNGSERKKHEPFFLSLSLLSSLGAPFFFYPIPAPAAAPSGAFLAQKTRPYLSLAQESSGRSAESGRGRVGVEGRGRPLCRSLALSTDDDRRATSNASSGGLGGARGAGQVGRAGQGGLHLLLRRGYSERGRAGASFAGGRRA